MVKNKKTLFFLFYFKNGIASLIGPKLTTIPRFKGIKQMWIGGDYSITNKWQWRGYYKAFTGNANTVITISVKYKKFRGCRRNKKRETNDALFTNYWSFYTAKETPIRECRTRCLFTQMVNINR